LPSKPQTHRLGLNFFSFFELTNFFILGSVFFSSPQRRRQMKGLEKHLQPKECSFSTNIYLQLQLYDYGQHHHHHCRRRTTMRRRMKDGARDAYASRAHVCFFFYIYIDYTNIYLQMIQYNYSRRHHHHHHTMKLTQR
jgi:hypothetical protein